MTDYFCLSCETLLRQFGRRDLNQYKCPSCHRFFSRERLEELDETY